jgi:hypothetical protein
MRKNLGYVLILTICALSLPGCEFMRTGGPCYGVGCPAGAGAAGANDSDCLAEQPGRGGGAANAGTDRGRATRAYSGSGSDASTCGSGPRDCG